MKSGAARTRSFLFGAAKGRRKPDGTDLRNMADKAREERLIIETGVEKRIADMIDPVLEDIGFKLVRVNLSGQNGLTLQIMAERFDGTMTVEDCEEVSKAVSPVLDVEDPIDRAYHLEISSPGIDRPMVRKSDFYRWKGHLLKCETSVLIGERKRFRGRIIEADNDGFTLLRDGVAYGEPNEVTIPFSALSDAKLILTDELIREALRADKLAKEKAANENDDDDGVEDTEEN